MVLASERCRHFRPNLKDNMDLIRYIYLVILLSTTDSPRSIEGCSQDTDCKYGHCRERLCVMRWKTQCLYHTNDSCQVTNNCSVSANETCVYDICWRPLPCLNSTTTTTTDRTTKQSTCAIHMDCLDDELCENGACVLIRGQGPEVNNSREQTNRVVLIVAGILGVLTLVFVVKCYYKTREIRTNRRLQRQRRESSHARSVTSTYGAEDDSSYGQICFTGSSCEQNATNRIVGVLNVNSLATRAQAPSGSSGYIIAITALGITPPSYEQTLEMDSCLQPPPSYDDAISSEINQ